MIYKYTSVWNKINLADTKTWPEQHSQCIIWRYFTKYRGKMRFIGTFYYTPAGEIGWQGAVFWGGKKCKDDAVLDGDVWCYPPALPKIQVDAARKMP